MWIDRDLSKVPSTRKPFYMSSYKGDTYVTKPGKTYILEDGWKILKETTSLNDKMESVYQSPLCKSSIHIPKNGQYLAIHLNKIRSRLTLIPLPLTSLESKSNILEQVLLPNGEFVLLTTPIIKGSGDNLLKGKGIGDSLRGVAVSDTGHMCAVATHENFWIWQQLPEQPRGVGWWYDITSDNRFGVNLMANHPRTDQYPCMHGFMKPKQSFTLHPCLSPELPSNSAVCYQDLALFDNPDEGKGVISLTTLLPPSKPFDELYLFVSVATFDEQKVNFFRASKKLEIAEGGGSPCIWWSADCRIAVIAVSKSIVIITRNLDILNVIPLRCVFPGEEPLVSSVGWSCCGGFFVITSFCGDISAITRNGISLRHHLCGLSSFSRERDIPLMVCGDALDPGLFTIYSRKNMKHLRLDLSVIPQSLDVYISLPFPQGGSLNMYEPTLNMIESTNYEDPIELCKLLYFADTFGIFTYQSPLRNMIYNVAATKIKDYWEKGMYFLCYFLVRCVLRVTDMEVPTYEDAIKKYGTSKSPRDSVLFKILEVERNFGDYILDRTLKNEKSIYFYDSNYDDKNITYIKQPSCKDEELQPILQAVKNALYGDVPQSFMEIRIELLCLFDFLISVGRFNHAFALSKHSSIQLEPLELYERIIENNKNPAIIFLSMLECISQQPMEEISARSKCVVALTSLLQDIVAETNPGSDKRVKRVSNICVVEDQFDPVSPETEEQLYDFAVIFSLAILAADVNNVLLFLDKKNKQIPLPLVEPIYKLIRILWFVKWRFVAMDDIIVKNKTSDSVLRLISFPDMINVDVFMAVIRDSNVNNFSADIYSHYMNGDKNYNDDPDFVDFAVQLKNSLNTRLLPKVRDSVQLVFLDKNKVPQSKLVFAAVLSHVLPWLRCAICRGMTQLIHDNLPEELFNFDDDVEYQESPEVTMINERTLERTLSQLHQTTEYPEVGEFVPLPPESSGRRKRKKRVRVVYSSDDSSSSSSESSSSSIEVRRKIKKKRKRKLYKSDSDDEIKKDLRPLLVGKQTKYRPPLYIDLPQVQQFPMANLPYNMYQYPDQIQQYGYCDFIPQYIGAYIPQPDMNFAPCWDANFDNYRPPTKEEQKNKTDDDKKHNISTSDAQTNTNGISLDQTQHAKPQIIYHQVQPERPQNQRTDNSQSQKSDKPILIVSSRQDPPTILPPYDLEFSASSEISDLNLAPIERSTVPYLDPYPHDNGLHERITRLLDQSHDIIPPMKDTPRFRRPDETFQLHLAPLHVVKESYPMTDPYSYYYDHRRGLKQDISPEKGSTRMEYSDIPTKDINNNVNIVTHESEFHPQAENYSNKHPIKEDSTNFDDTSSTGSIKPDFYPSVNQTKNQNVISVDKFPRGSNNTQLYKSSGAKKQLILKEIKPPK